MACLSPNSTNSSREIRWVCFVLTIQTLGCFWIWCPPWSNLTLVPLSSCSAGIMMGHIFWGNFMGRTWSCQSREHPYNSSFLTQALVKAEQTYIESSQPQVLCLVVSEIQTNGWIESTQCPPKRRGFSSMVVSWWISCVLQKPFLTTRVYVSASHLHLFRLLVNLNLWLHRPQPRILSYWVLICNPWPLMLASYTACLHFHVLIWRSSQSIKKNYVWRKILR